MNDNFIEDLNQIRDRQVELLDQIEECKIGEWGTTLSQLFHIQTKALKVLDDIDEIRKRCEDSSHSLSRAGKSGTANPD